MTAFPTASCTNRPTNLWHHVGLAIDLHPVAGLELAAPLGFLEAVHPHLTALDALLGFTAGEHQALPFEELIEADRLGTLASGAGTW